MHKMTEEAQNRLFEAVLQLKTTEECKNFFDDLCSIAELHSMTQRFEVAEMLDQKKVYTDIVAKTGASSATISRVNHCLLYGPGGYRTVLERLKEQDHE